ncbi:MAG: polyprenyl synthetase family protein [Pseudomonadota bacterium]
MAIDARINAALENALAATRGSACPGGLAEAMHYAVFPGGHRIRPRLCLAVAAAYETADPDVVDAALASIELLHCASLVHDDMPCFDNADTRRGKPAVHVEFGEPLALLCGDALIVQAFQVLASRGMHAPRRAATLMGIVSSAVGAPDGIVAGQAWECESTRNFKEYQRGKTGVLFAAATMSGAAAAGAPHEPWRALGEAIGGAYQVADDLLDHFGSAEVIGKPVGRDELLERTNAVDEWGADGASGRLEQMIECILDTVPVCPGRPRLLDLIAEEAGRFSSQALKARDAA